MDVLVVEDEAPIRETFAEVLESIGLDVASAETAERALDLGTQAGRPGVILTDVNLGAGMDGVALAKEARRRWPGVPVVIFSGDPTNYIRCDAEGLKPFYLKPVDLFALTLSIEQLLARPGGPAAA